MLPSSSEKISQSKLLFDRYINANLLVERLDAQAESTIITPKMFMHGLTKRCQQSPQHIILPESSDKRVLKAAEDVTRRGIARITLLGEPEAVHAQAKLFNVDISQCEVVDPIKSPAFDRYAAAVCEARKSKNMTPEQVMWGGGVFVCVCVYLCVCIYVCVFVCVYLCVCIYYCVC